MTWVAVRCSVFEHATPSVGVHGKLLPFRGIGDIAFRTGLFGKLLILVSLASPCSDLTLIADKATSPVNHPETAQQDSHDRHHNEERP
jgi:hypothetical protein